MFLPADVLARCSWHKSGLCSVYCLIGKALPHLQKQVMRKSVIINRQFKLTQRKSKTHSKTLSMALQSSPSQTLGGEGLIGSSVQSPERSYCSLWESFLYFFSFLLPSFLQSSQVNSQELCGRKRPNPACKLQNKKKEFGVVKECRQVS